MNVVVIAKRSIQTEWTMKIDKARAAAKLLYVLLRFRVISDRFYHKSKDYLTVKSLSYQLKEIEDDKSSKG